MTSERGFLDLMRVSVPRHLADAANDHLRSVGLLGNEGFALWAGRCEGSTFHVLETLIPKQRAIRSQDGVCVVVESEELFRLNQYLYSRGFSVVAQLHSHPDEAFHSATDDALPIATVAGALSLVVPDFAAHPFALHRCAVYQLLPRRGWVELSPPVAARLIEIYDEP